MNGETLLHAGIAVMGLSALLAAAAALRLHAAGKRLRQQLEEEFGKKRR